MPIEHQSEVEQRIKELEQVAGLDKSGTDLENRIARLEVVVGVVPMVADNGSDQATTSAKV